MIHSDRYSRLYNQLALLTRDSINLTAQIATLNAILYHKLDYVFWIGAYFLKADQLQVGPYQGPLACQVLESNKGVCWSAVHKKKTIVVPDVNQFPDHIACDSRSKSEIVFPLLQNERVIAVIDVDSDRLNAFQQTEAEGLERIISILNPNLPIL